MTLKKEILLSETETVNSKQVTLLKKHFPNCFDRDGNFIPERMNEIVTADEIELSKESYSLNWLGKSYARLLTNIPPETMIKADVEHNSKEGNIDSQNLLLKGDNLEVLKHLVNAYSERVKMIYIDPPYNTGSDGFTYQDDKKFTKEQLSELAGIDADEAERILEFTDSKPNSHSAWLTFIYPRLYIAKELMADDGVIFISIDDNEQGQLKLLCDEIFGEVNLLCQFTWRTGGNFDNQAKIKNNHEYIIAYTKTPESFNFPELIDLNVDEDSKLFNTNIINTIVKNGPKNPVSKVKLPVGFKANFEDGIISEQNNSFPHFLNDAHIENGELVNEVIVESGWSSKRNLELFINNNLRSTIDTKGQETEYYLTENGAIESIKKRTVQSHVVSVLMNMGNTQSMGKKLSEEFAIPFSYPKPITLLEYLIEIVSDKKAVVMDFFAGSGTTAHAVISLNCKDNGARKHISVQLPENTDPTKEAYKAGYETIFDITKARIEKAAEKIKEENSDYEGDLGFKIFETTDDFRGNLDQLSLDDLSFLKDEVLSDGQYQTLLTTWCLYDGSLLTDPATDTDLSGYTAHYCDGRLYMIAPNFSIDALKSLLEKLDSEEAFAPHKVIFYGSNFDSAKQMELHEALRSYANKKSIDIEVVARY